MKSEGMGTVISFGFNKHGQLGQGNKQDFSTPQNINLTNITKIACGGGHTVALTARGELYLWGDGRNGLATFATPKLVAALRGKRVSNIACGSLHTLAVVEDKNGDPAEIYGM